MAAAVLNPGTAKKKKKASRGKLPVKRSINLIGVGEKRIQMGVAVPAIILILLAAAALSKFGVVDRLIAVSDAEREVSLLRAELNDAYRTLEGYGELAEEYAHYTVSGMSREELSRVDRGKVVELIQRVILPTTTSGTWSLTGNQLSLSITGQTLQEINLLVQALNEEELVDFCTVRTASTDDKYYDFLDEDSTVTAQISVYLVAREGY
ncbi:MAG: hypothetical protein IKO91_02060 [Oscillospiraceae bacterium]|nr:hypothetical protein [Oscillospiraceae bacterium]